MPLTKTWISASVEKSCLPVRADWAVEAEVPLFGKPPRIWPVFGGTVLIEALPLKPVSPMLFAWKVFWPPVIVPPAIVPPTLPVTFGLVCCV